MKTRLDGQRKAGRAEVKSRCPISPPPFPPPTSQEGEKISQRCAQCHDWSKGGPNKIGPNLWNVLGSQRGEGRGGYAFSAAMKKKGGTWTYAELFRFLKHPQVYIPGTKMTFAGLKSEKQRLDIIAYIRTWADTPAPLPAPQAAKPADATAAKPTDAAPRTEEVSLSPRPAFPRLTARGNAARLRA